MAKRLRLPCGRVQLLDEVRVRHDPFFRHGQHFLALLFSSSSICARGIIGIFQGLSCLALDEFLCQPARFTTHHWWDIPGRPGLLRSGVCGATNSALGFLSSCIAVIDHLGVKGK